MLDTNHLGNLEEVEMLFGEVRRRGEALGQGPGPLLEVYSSLSAGCSSGRVAATGRAITRETYRQSFGRFDRMDNPGVWIR